MYGVDPFPSSHAAEGGGLYWPKVAQTLYQGDLYAARGRVPCGSAWRSDAKQFLRSLFAPKRACQLFKNYSPCLLKHGPHPHDLYRIAADNLVFIFSSIFNCETSLILEMTLQMQMCSKVAWAGYATYLDFNGTREKNFRSCGAALEKFRLLANKRWYSLVSFYIGCIKSGNHDHVLLYIPFSFSLLPLPSSRSVYNFDMYTLQYHTIERLQLTLSITSAYHHFVCASFPHTTLMHAHVHSPFVCHCMPSSSVCLCAPITFRDVEVKLPDLHFCDIAPQRSPWPPLYAQQEKMQGKIFCLSLFYKLK